METLRGVPLIEVIGRGGRWSGEARPPIIEGRRPGCEDDLPLEWFDEPLGIVGTGGVECGTEPLEVTDSVGDGERVLDGAEIFRLFEIVPRVVELS